jgi:FG-GAP-like repeat/ASPIC and UnbV
VQDAGNGWSYGGAWGDFDNDGWLDLMIVNHIGPAHLYRNNRDGGFIDVTEQMLGQVGAGYFGVTWGDYNGDGWLDLIITGRDLHPLRLFRNTGEGFVDVTETAGLSNIYGARASMADVDNDSVPDLVICSLSETQPCRLFRNLNAEHANWAEIWVDDTHGKLNGYGTKVHVYVAGQDQLRVFGAPADYAQSDLPLWLGLGQASTANVKVEWPDGTWDTWQERAWYRTVTSKKSP